MDLNADLGEPPAAGAWGTTRRMKSIMSANVARLSRGRSGHQRATIRMTRGGRRSVRIRFPDP